jgi:hypothetical protein
MSTDTATLVQETDNLVELPVGSPNYKLSALFRCDHSATVGTEYSAGGRTGISCGSQSYIKATLKAGGELFFCKHHANAVEEKLKPMCSEWYTEANRLIENRKQGSEN